MGTLTAQSGEANWGIPEIELWTDAVTAVQNEYDCPRSVCVTRFFALMFAFFTTSMLHAEVPKKAQQLTIDQRLSQSTVGSVYTAQDGRIWFATGDGISIYDGQSFEYLYRSADTEEGLQDNYIRTIFADSVGRVWVGTYGGGISVFTQSAKFLFGLQKEAGVLPAIDIYDFAEDATGAAGGDDHRPGFDQHEFSRSDLDRHDALDAPVLDHQIDAEMLVEALDRRILDRRLEKGVQHVKAGLVGGEPGPLDLHAAESAHIDICLLYTSDAADE